ncbi:MAG: DNA polymerase III subunit delta' [Candidatus Peregrinibacteria bacterium Greene0416_19]|nr:MAG: DNA polymerase III subunit delta' [Candidatus Peregrinibacteria bacterium Greene0416_19]
MSNASAIIGHAPQRSSLLDDLSTGNVAHAYLFVGPKSLGKFTVAKWFAHELLTAGVDDEAGQKRVRAEAEKLIHPDLLIIDRLWIEDVCEDFNVLAEYSNIPQQHRSKAKAKTDTISIDDVRMLQERLYETGTGRYRCCLIRSAERMQDEALTSLLKILEEPPQGVVFLLTTQSQSSLLPTVVSRCRTLRFSRVPKKELAPLLAGVDDDEAAFMLHVAQGAPGAIRRLRDDPDLLRAEKILHENARAFWVSGRISERLQLLFPLHERGPESDRLLLHLALALRERGEGLPVREAQAFQTLVDGLRTNAQRQLLTQRFALEVSL